MTDPGVLTILIIEDEVLVAIDLEMLLRDLGHIVVGIATNFDDAISLARDTQPRLALVDINLADGPTGVAAAREIAAGGKTSCVFMSANTAMIPEDFALAVGSIGKPYSEAGMRSAVGYLTQGLLTPPPLDMAPAVLRMSKTYADKWAV